MEILLLKTGNVSWNEISGFLGCLDAARRKSVLAKSCDSDKTNSLLSRLMMLSELEKRTGIPRKRLSFALGTHGKPYLKNSELFFSISHTAGAIIAAFSEGEEIGADVERKNRRVNERLYARVLSDEEQKSVHGTEDFLRLWVQKEAFLKRLGVGITRDLRAVSPENLPDTAAIDCGDYIIGASGKGAKEAAVREITLEELLSRFVKQV